MDRGSADAIPRLRSASRYGRAGHRLIRINDRLRICFVWTGSDGEQVEITYITRTYYSSPARAKRATEDAMRFAIISRLPQAGPFRMFSHLSICEEGRAKN